MARTTPNPDRVPKRIAPVAVPNRKAMPTDKTSFQASNTAKDKKFNRGAVKPFVPKGGRAPQKDLNVPPVKAAPTGRGPGYDGSKGYTK